jgi:mannitol/fructose-specific phosphotransferase system IIA component (Ntr-type)
MSDGSLILMSSVVVVAFMGVLVFNHWRQTVNKRAKAQLQSHGQPRHGTPAAPVPLRNLISLDLVKLELDGTSRDEILRELVSLLTLDEKSAELLLRMLKRRQDLGSTGMGRGMAIVYARTLTVSRLSVGFGRKPEGIEFRAMDGKPVHYFFVVLAPPFEESNQFLPVLGKIAQLAKEPDVSDRLAALQGPEEFLELLDEKGV